MLIKNLGLKRINKLGEIKFSESPVKTRQGSYNWELIKRFPSKNSVKLTRWIIKKYSKEGSHICDPMCGIGTSLVEGIKLKRTAYGFEINKETLNAAVENCKLVQTLHRDCGNFKVIWDGGQTVTDYLPRDFIDLVVFSPPYGKQNHMMGNSPKQVAARAEKHLYSCQEYFNDDYKEFDVVKGGMKDFYRKMGAIVEASVNAMKRGAYMVIIIQDYVRKGKPVGIVQAMVDMVLEQQTMESTGFYIRDQSKSYFKITQLKRGNSVIGVEHTLIFRKVGYNGDNR